MQWKIIIIADRNTPFFFKFQIASTELSAFEDTLPAGLLRLIIIFGRGALSSCRGFLAVLSNDHISAAPVSVVTVTLSSNGKLIVFLYLTYRRCTVRLASPSRVRLSSASRVYCENTANGRSQPSAWDSRFS